MSDKLPDKDELLAVLIASGRSYRQAAKGAGYSVATVQGRMADPTFRGRVAEIRLATARRVSDLVTEAAIDAVKALRNCLNDPDGKVVVQAGRALLMAYTSIKTIIEFDDRMSEIEGRVRLRDRMLTD